MAGDTDRSRGFMGIVERDGSNASGIAGMKPMNRKELIADLIEFNPELTGQQALDFADRILEAESRDDLVMMNALIQEAVYGYGNNGRKTAA